VEAALARAEAGAEEGMIPHEAAKAIACVARLELLDRKRIEEGFARTGHTVVPLVCELGRVTGDPYGGFVHWGATTQNITQTRDLLVLRQGGRVFLKLIGEALLAMADLAEKGAEMPIAGRTHGQHALPATFGLKPATWIDEFLRHVVAMVEWHPGELYPRVGFIVTNLARLAECLVAFYNQRGTCKQHIKESENAIKWARLSCPAPSPPTPSASRSMWWPTTSATPCARWRCRGAKSRGR
jgi:adenylosuccinate lyase